MKNNESVNDQELLALRNIAVQLCETESFAIHSLTRIPPTDKTAEDLSDDECALLLAITVASQEESKFILAMSVNPTLHLVNPAAKTASVEAAKVAAKAERQRMASQKTTARDIETENESEDENEDGIIAELERIYNDSMNNADQQPCSDAAAQVWREWVSEHNRLDCIAVRQRGRRRLQKAIDNDEPHRYTIKHVVESVMPQETRVKSADDPQADKGTRLAESWWAAGEIPSDSGLPRLPRLLASFLIECEGKPTPYHHCAEPVYGDRERNVTGTRIPSLCKKANAFFRANKIKLNLSYLNESVTIERKFPKNTFPPE